MFISIVSCLTPFYNQVKWNKSDLDPPKCFKIYFILSSGQDLLSPPQLTGCDPSLANEAHLVVARHPGTSFPVHHPQEAVPKSTNGNLSPSLSWSSPLLGPL